MNIKKAISRIFRRHTETLIDMSVPSIKQAHEVGMGNQDGFLANPYQKGTPQYIAWDAGSHERERRDMTIW